jgi:hypothetical protein
MAEHVAQKISANGLKPTFSSTDTNGDTFINDGETYLHIKNNNASLQSTITIYAKNPCNHGTLHNIVVSIPATEERQFGPFPIERFNDLYRKVSFNCTLAGSSVTAAVIKL